MGLLAESLLRLLCGVLVRFTLGLGLKRGTKIRLGPKEVSRLITSLAEELSDRSRVALFRDNNEFSNGQTFYEKFALNSEELLKYQATSNRAPRDSKVGNWYKLLICIRGNDSVLKSIIYDFPFLSSLDIIVVELISGISV